MTIYRASQPAIKTQPKGDMEHKRFFTADQAPPRIPNHPFQRLQQTIGNRSVGRLLHAGLIQAKLRIGPANDRYEQEADRVAAQVTRLPDEVAVVQRRAITPAHELAEAPALVHHTLRLPGRPLAPGVRAAMESQFGRDLSHIRVHTGELAATSAQAIGSRAYTLGSHIVFNSGEYRPQTSAGRWLLAHELAHTMQQGAPAFESSALIQRQEEPGSGPGAPITARSIFPYEQGSQVTLNRLLGEIELGLIALQNRQLASTLRSLVARTATVNTATDDVFDATIHPQAATDKQPARPALALRLERSGSTFTLSFFAVDDKGERTVINAITGLNPRRHNGGVALSGSVGGQNIDIAVRPGETSGSFVLKALSPVSLDVLDIRQLPNAPAGSQEQRKAVEQAVASTSKARKSFQNQRLQIGAGSIWLEDRPAAGLLTASWQINFVPTRLQTLFQVPLELQLQYAPQTALLGSLTSGVETSLSPLVPVNVRLVSGFGGGFARQESTPGADKYQYLLGPVLGGAIGLEHDWFRANIHYEHLWNILEDMPAADTFTVRFGGAF